MALEKEASIHMLFLGGETWVRVCVVAALKTNVCARLKTKVCKGLRVQMAGALHDAVVAALSPPSSMPTSAWQLLDELRPLATRQPWCVCRHPLCTAFGRTLTAFSPASALFAQLVWLMRYVCLIAYV